MVKQSVLTIAAMAETHPELVKDLPVVPGHRDVDASGIRHGDAGRFIGEQKD
ncbi:hypothetical protein D3C84_1056180 [compost metagenome]